MSGFELAIILIACLLPIVALLIILPKRIRKKQNAQAKPQQPADEFKPSAPIVEQPSINNLANANVSADTDFKSYLQNKRKNISAPERKNPPLFESEFNPFNGTQKKESEPNKLNINDLNPVLKAMIIAGVLDKKY